MGSKMDPDEAPRKRKTWKNNVDFLFTTIGSYIGLGNVWRFPYVCYKNGGGAFLLAYFGILAVLCFPCMVLESALGQYIGRSTVKAWEIIPLMRGIGVFGPVICASINIYYPVILTWASRWFVDSFSTVLPWTSCNNTWNTDRCVEVLNLLHNDTNNISNSESAFQNGSRIISGVTSIEEFWRIRVLGRTSSIEDLGEMQWDLFACLSVIWILTYLTLWKGIGWTSKVVYVTATVPIVMLIIILVKGLTLQGASAGIELYLKPNLTKLGEAGLWHDAASQITFSFGIGAGILTTLSGYNKFHHNFFRDLAILASANAAASFLSGFVIFSTLGYLAHNMNVSVDEVATSGPGLVFVVYPTALSLLPVPQLWCALFFLMLILLGFDSQFMWVESFMAAMRDLFPKIFVQKLGREQGLAIISVVSFLFGLLLITGGGVYWLNLLDAYAVTGWCILFTVIAEFITVGWLYRVETLCHEMREMLGYNIPRLWFKICVRFIGPTLATVLLVLSLVKYKPLGYKGEDVYPGWVNALGWIVALSSVMWIPGIAIYTLYKADGESFTDKLNNSFRVPASRRSNLRDEHAIEEEKESARIKETQLNNTVQENAAVSL